MFMWQLPISVDKCYVLSVVKVLFSPTLSINDHTLPIVSTARDLGITVTSNLSPSAHVCDMVSRAHKRASAIHRCFLVT